MDWGALFYSYLWGVGAAVLVTAVWNIVNHIADVSNWKKEHEEWVKEMKGPFLDMCGKKPEKPVITLDEVKDDILFSLAFSILSWVGVGLFVYSIYVVNFAKDIFKPK